MTLQVDILSLFPGYFQSPLKESMLKRAQEKGILTVNLHDIRHYSTDKHKRVDDRPFGGGPGMVMMAKPVADAIKAAKQADSYVVYLSPQGTKLTAQKAKQLAKKKSLILLCGHYEGIDERALIDVDEQISIGDYVLTNGCLPALVLLDTVIRYVPGVLGDEESAKQDSFEEGLLDCQHYTKPVNFAGESVPEVLLSGHHQNIEKWRRQKQIEKTAEVRPDLWFAADGVEVKELENKFFIKLYVKNLKKSLEFYRQKMAAAVKKIDAQRAIAIINGQQFYIVQEQVQDLPLEKKMLFCTCNDNQNVEQDPEGFFWSI